MKQLVLILCDWHVHSLFLSIAGCKGLESTIAFGGEACRVMDAPLKLNWSIICNCGGSPLRLFELFSWPKKENLISQIVNKILEYCTNLRPCRAQLLDQGTGRCESRKSPRNSAIARTMIRMKLETAERIKCFFQSLRCLAKIFLIQ